MVTGVETAGIVLAVVPLLIVALEKWHAGFVKTKQIAGRRKKDRERLAAKIKGLVTKLTWHDVQLNINLKTLLFAVDDELVLEDLPRDYRDHLWTGSSSAGVENYLRRIGGEEAITAFKGVIESCELLIKEIAENFEHSGRDPQSNKRDLKTLVKFLAQAPDKVPVKGRFGFTLHEKDIDRLTKELEDTSRSIGSFVAGAGHLDKLMAHSTSERSSKQLKKMTKQLYSRRRQAFTLHKVFQTCWVYNCQHTEHNTLLLIHLDSQANTTTLPADPQFHVLFQWFCDAEPNPQWKDSAVIMNTDSLILPAPRAGTSRSPTVKLPANSTRCDEVTDICHQVCLAHSNSKDIQFHVSDDNRLYCVQGSNTQTQPTLKKIRILPQTPCLLSLSSYLTSTRRKLLDRKRIELAIKLACSILQYNETPWFARGWRKEHIYFFEDPMTGAAIDVDHPLISEPFSPNPVSTVPAPMPPEPQDTLLDFAILLMELYHRTTFEDWTRQHFPNVSLQQLEDVDWKRVYANKWYRAAMPRDADFRGVVSVCLLPHPLEQYESSWEDENFRCAFYEHVVAPLLIF